MSDDLIEILVVDRDGNEHMLQAPVDMNLNVMEVCRASEIPIEGTCGGMALCASCQVYVESEHFLNGISEDEQAMLDEAWCVEDNSRLGCQIKISNDLDGLIVRLAKESVEVDSNW